MKKEKIVVILIVFSFIFLSCAKIHTSDPERISETTDDLSDDLSDEALVESEADAGTDDSSDDEMKDDEMKDDGTYLFEYSEAENADMITRQWGAIGFESNDIPYSVAVDKEGNIYVTGATDGSMGGAS